MKYSLRLEAGHPCAQAILDMAIIPDQSSPGHQYHEQQSACAGTHQQLGSGGAGGTDGRSVLLRQL